MTTAPPTATYTAMPVQDLPYPAGLGKMADYPGLELEMRRYLGEHWRNVEVNESAFWSARYQRIITEHLGEEHFAPQGDIVEIAKAALRWARTSRYFDTTVEGHPVVAERLFKHGLAIAPDGAEATVVRHWMTWTPRLVAESDGSHTIVEGRHRLSYLRSRIQPIEPTFPVLVLIIR